jgi:hypothetical protein
VTIVSIDHLPDDSRIWVFGAAEPLTDSQRAAIDTDLSSFVQTWAAHGAQLLAAHDIVEHTFVIIAVDERAHGASGCSIDAMTRHLADLEAALQVSLLDGQRIWYRDEGGDIVSCDRSGFRTRSEQGQVDADTRVFDPTILTLEDLRTGGFERAAADSWHGRLLSSSRASASG